MVEGLNQFPGRLALQQRVLPAYRVDFFDALAAGCRGGLSVFAGQPQPGEQIATSDRLSLAKYFPARNRHFLKVSSPFYRCWQDGWIEWLEGWQPDALIVEANPLSGADRFTLEVVFRPDAGGLVEQRFVHVQEATGDNRILIETRLTDDQQWFLDTFIKSGESSKALFAEGFKHPLGPWYHAALVYDGREMRHYVNGRQELASEVGFSPLRSGRVSLGMRLNRVSWFRGAIRTVRFTLGVLACDDFLRGW